MEGKILCIEDNHFNRRLVNKYLKTFGYQMLEAANGMIGLEIIKEEKPDVVLVDINLPDIDGLEIVKRIKKSQITAHIPMIALTANTMYGDRERCLDAGCDAYLAKPITRVELYDTLSLILEKQLVDGA